MIVSSSQISPDESLEAEVVVVGSGAAGIPIALQMADAGVNVILLEAGGEPVRDRDQALYTGTVVDPKLHQPADKYRQRRLGGSTVTWGGRCVPYDPIDIQERDYVPLSGWPLSYEELARYFPAANKWLELGEFQYDNKEAFSDRAPPMIEGFDSEQISLDSLERFSRPTDMYRRYRGRLEVSENLRLVYDANVALIALKETGESVDRLVVSTLSGKRFSVRAHYYVLAVGGIETARLLLASNDVSPHGIGNEHDVVGRYYQCHIASNVGRLEFSIPKEKIRHGYEISPDGIYCRRRISLVPAEQLKRRVNNVVLRLHFPKVADPAHRSGVLSMLYLVKRFISYEYATRLRDGDHDTFKSWLLHWRNAISSPFENVRFLLFWLFKRTLAGRKFPSVILKNKTNVFSLEVHGEQIPNADSRITLSDERDELGIPKVTIDWRYSPQDIQSVRETLAVFRDELARLGIGRLTFDDSTLEKDLLRFGAYGGHHIGTARMGNDPHTSVVDADCKIHGVDNLYIASSAVFRTSSQANPTLTITALALRLGEHLVARITEARRPS